MKIFFDIETIPEQPEDDAKAIISSNISAPKTMSKPETVEDWHNGTGKYSGAKEKAVDEQYRKGSFDGAKGQICSISFSDGESVDVLSDKDSNGEKGLIESVFSSMSNILSFKKHISAPFFVGHYIQFDLKFLWQRCVIHGVKPPFDLPFNGRHGQQYYDNMVAWAGHKGTISQDNLASALGISRRPTDIDGSKVWDAYKGGRIDDIAEYNKIDVETVIKIYNKINFV